MTVIAGFTGTRRVVVRQRGFAGLFSLVLGTVTGLTLIYLSLVVIGLNEWNPRYLIPLGGMLLGNAMTAGTLAMEQLVSDLRQSGNDVEVMLAMGASPDESVRSFRCTAIGAAMTPTLNTMMVVGVVQLPGMMTGQMLGGFDPFQAAMYQLLILIAIAFCAALSTALIVELIYRQFFTATWQFKRL